MPSNPPALMWMEDNPKTPLARRLANGADVYKLRMGIEPTHVIVSPLEFEDAVKAAPAGITVIPSNPKSGTVAKNIYWFLRNGGE